MRAFGVLVEDTSVTVFTVGDYKTIIGSTSAFITGFLISGTITKDAIITVAVGGVGSEVDIFGINVQKQTPINTMIPVEITEGTRVSAKSDQEINNDGKLVVSLFGR